MYASRAVPRAQCLARTCRTRAMFRNYASQSESSSTGSNALVGGLIGSGVTVAIGYTWYHFSGAKTAVQTATQAKSYIDQTFHSLKQQVPSANANADDILKTLRDTATTYAVFIPGGRAFVDSSFKDIDTIRKKHGGEVDKIVREASSELRDVSQKGFSLETLTSAVDVLVKHLNRLSGLASDAAGDIIEQHPQLKEKIGGSVDQLKSLGDRYGPEVKEQVESVQKEMRDILKNGFQADTVGKLQKLLQEKTQQIQKAGEQAYDKGMNEIQPMLEKNPKVKELVQSNLGDLKNGNIGKIIEQVRSAIKNGDTGDLEKYINQIKDKGQDQAQQWLGSIPQGGQVLKQLSELQGLAKKKGSEAEDLLKETVDEIKKVLQDKIKKANDLSKKE